MAEAPSLFRLSINLPWRLLGHGHCFPISAKEGSSMATTTMPSEGEAFLKEWKRS
jgi:hypothetical protein